MHSTSYRSFATRVALGDPAPGVDAKKEVTNDADYNALLLLKQALVQMSDDIHKAEMLHILPSQIRGIGLSFSLLSLPPSPDSHKLNLLLHTQAYPLHSS